MGKINGNRGIISGSIRHQKIVWIVVAIVVAFGIYALVKMKKDEFPAFSYPQGIVAGVYPGASSEEVEAQLTKPLEELLFTLPEVDRKNTYSVTKEGICYVYVMLDLSMNEYSKAWTKIRQKINEAKALSFPAGVLAIAVIDDFGNTSSLLIAMESPDKTYREMQEYTDDLTHRLREIPETGNVHVMGEQTEEIAVTIDKEKLSFYGIGPNSLMLEYASQGLLTTSGTMNTDDFNLPLHIDNPVVSEKEIEEQIIFTDPSGNTVRLRDVATVERRLAPPSKVVNFNGHNALIISVEMRKGFNIVAYGRKVEKVLSEFKATLPDSVMMYRITDQPKVVRKSVNAFLRDLLISMIVVIAVMLMLFPFRTALIASSGLPICTAVSIGLMYLFGIELNTVTLAALIVVLGMIVDDSIINIDGYIDKLSQGYKPFDAAVSSAKELFMPMFIATAAIATMFFPMTRIITGPLGDFVQLFPWTVAFSLMASLAYAMLVIPALEIMFIKPETDKPRLNGFIKAQMRFFNFIQGLYDKMQSHCFKHPLFTIGMGLGSIALGVFMFLALNVQMMPNAERDCFAVEIRLPEGSSLEATTRISDSLQQMILSDSRVTSVTAFIGETAPRFHVTYAPSIPADNLSQLIVNTTSQQATEALLKEMDDKYAYYFKEAHVRFRQMDYQAVTTPVEIQVYGDDREKTAPVAQKIKDYMLTLDKELRWVHSDYDEFTPGVKVTMKPEECARLGVTKSILSLDLAASLNGRPLTTVWEGNRSIPVKLYARNNYDPNDYESVKNQLVPTLTPGASIPLRQVADISPEWHPAQLTHHNGKSAIIVAADMKFWKSQTASMKKIKQFINTEVVPTLPEGVSIQYGGLSSLNTMVIPQILESLIAAILVLLAFLVVYFKKFSLAFLTLGSSTLCMFGAFFGEWLFGLDFGITSVLGVVSLIGIIVRNGIVMYEYAETLRTEEGLTAKEAAMKAGSRRMRPIFLTSATTALGVLPMIITRNPLWMPMGVVICFGVVLSMVIILAVMPVMYWQIFRSNKKPNQPQAS
ncbi:MAG: efflux RND transporter permease subunit [Bacteroidales bacterium]|nr:efflux RND transporter permease subunit [Bacteroidales bacterium]